MAGIDDLLQMGLGGGRRQGPRDGSGPRGQLLEALGRGVEGGVELTIVRGPNGTFIIVDKSQPDQPLGEFATEEEAAQALQEMQSGGGSPQDMLAQIFGGA
jgi:hypothetical protein